MKLKKYIFPKKINVQFDTKDGRRIKLPAKQGTVFYEAKDVRKYVRGYKEAINQLLDDEIGYFCEPATELNKAIVHYLVDLKQKLKEKGEIK